jgi:hypothetical protein
MPREIGALRAKLTNMLSIFADFLELASRFQPTLVNGCSPPANLIFPACLGKCLDSKPKTAEFVEFGAKPALVRA